MDKVRVAIDVSEEVLRCDAAGCRLCDEEVGEYREKFYKTLKITKVKDEKK